MPPIVHCVRHAQGYHNLSNANHAIRDPSLTTLGEEQCRTLAQKFPYHDCVDCVVASPMRRTLYTALLGFGQDLDKNGLKIVALPELQETSDLPCDTGSAPEALAKEFESKPVDLQLVHPGWNEKKGKFSPAGDALNARAREARLWLMARPEKEIVVVTHGAFLHLLTDDWSDSARFNGTGWANTEFRSYTLAPVEKEHEPASDVRMNETEASRLRRHPAEAKPLSREEQARAKAATEKEWQEQGYADKGKTQEIERAKI